MIALSELSLPSVLEDATTSPLVAVGLGELAAHGAIVAGHAGPALLLGVEHADHEDLALVERLDDHLRQALGLLRGERLERQLAAGHELRGGLLRGAGLAGVGLGGVLAGGLLHLLVRLVRGRRGVLGLVDGLREAGHARRRGGRGGRSGSGLGLGTQEEHPRGDEADDGDEDDAEGRGDLAHSPAYRQHTPPILSPDGVRTRGPTPAAGPWSARRAPPAGRHRRPRARPSAGRSRSRSSGTRSRRGSTRGRRGSRRSGRCRTRSRRAAARRSSSASSRKPKRRCASSSEIPSTLKTCCWTSGVLIRIEPPPISTPSSTMS